MTVGVFPVDLVKFPPFSRMIVSHAKLMKFRLAKMVNATCVVPVRCLRQLEICVKAALHMKFQDKPKAIAIHAIRVGYPLLCKRSVRNAKITSTQP